MNSLLSDDGIPNLRCHLCKHTGDTLEIIASHVMVSHRLHDGQFKYRELVYDERYSLTEKVYRTMTFDITVKDICARMEQGFLPYLEEDRIRFKSRNEELESPAAKKSRTEICSEENDTEEMDYSQSELYAKMAELLPGVCDFLETTNPIHKERFLQQLSLMNDGKCPVENICYKVFEDLIQYHSIDNISQMRYEDDVRQFWMIGKKLFHQQFLQFRA